MTRSLQLALPCALLAVSSPILGQTVYPQSSRGRYGSSVGRTGSKGNPGTFPEEPLATFRGTVQGSGAKILVVKTDVDTVDFECSKKTTYQHGDSKIKAADLKVGDLVAVEARHTIDGKVMAVNVILDPPPERKTPNPSDVDAHQADVKK